MIKGLLGEHLGHSYSKLIHETLTDYQYELLEKSPQELDEFLKAKEFDGVNVTIPYKQTVLPYLDELDPAAKKIGAVNTIVNQNGRLKGYNTDYSGFIAMLKEAEIEISGRKVVVLGNGGASRAAVCALQDLGAREIIKVDIAASPGAISYEECYQKHFDAEVLVNTSPVGMYPKVNACPVDLDRFNKLEGVADVIYNPLRTRLVIEGQRRGLKCGSGMSMLVGQAVEAIRHFTGQCIEEKKILELSNALKREKMNLVLIGMPGSGKSTIAAKLQKKLNMPMIETDEEIIKRIKMPISEFFEKYGEERFREIETAVVHDIAGLTHTIISCGGGIIKKEENMIALKMNGRIIFLDRSTDKLAVADGRPLSPDRAHVEELYRQRIDLYRQYGEIRVENNGALSTAVDACAALIDGELKQEK